MDLTDNQDFVSINTPRAKCRFGWIFRPLEAWDLLGLRTIESLTIVLNMVTTGRKTPQSYKDRQGCVLLSYIEGKTQSLSTDVLELFCKYEPRLICTNVAVILLNSCRSDLLDKLRELGYKPDLKLVETIIGCIVDGWEEEERKEAIEKYTPIIEYLQKAGFKDNIDISVFPTA